MVGRALGLLALVVAAGGVSAADRADWPQLWGPEGNARAEHAGLFSGAAGVKVRELWRRPIGSGFSGVTVVAGRAYTGVADGEQDFVAAFDAGTGREVWRTPIGAVYRGHDGSRDGPISTPTVHGGRVFLVGPRGVLVALGAADGRVAWKHDLVAEFAAATPFYGFGTSPLVVDGRVVVQVNGDKQHQLVAFDAATGRIAWTAFHSAGAAYVTPTLATLHGTRQIVTVSSDRVLGVDAADGKLLWSVPRPPEGEASRPPLVLPDGRVLVHAWTDASLLQVTKDAAGWKAAEVWRTPLLKNSYSPTVFADGHLFGYNGAYLVCLDPATAAVKWRHKVYGGNLVLVDGHLVMLGTGSGDLRVAEASAAGYREKLLLPVFNAGAASFTGPSVADGRLYLRNVEEMVALEVVR